MVGVGGRSKACANCKRRRIKCDERKPTCQRCAKADLQCEGCAGMTIIQFDGRRGRHILPAARSSISPGAQDVSPGLQTLDVSGPVDTHLRLFSDDIFVQYTKARLLQSPNVDIELPPHIDRTLVDKSFLALATTFFGIEHRERDVLNKGLVQYGDALKIVRQALGDPSRLHSYDLLESIAVLSLFEFLMSDNEHGWLSHAVGLERLFSLRGPDSFKAYPNYIVFQNSRLPIITSSILLRRETVLSKPEWKSVPWSSDPGAKTDLEYLVDILADCPSLFIQKDNIESMLSSADWAVEMAKLHQSITDVLNRLDQWKHAWEVNNPGCSHEVSVPTSKPILVDQRGRAVPAWETVLEFSSLYHANTVVLYHATVILVQSLLQQLTFSGGFCTVPLRKDRYPDRTLSAALMICRSVDYHLQSMRKGAGSFVLLFPLRMAYDAVGRGNSPIGTWLQNVLQQVHDGRSGRWSTAKYLLDIKARKNLTEDVGITQER